MMRKNYLFGYCHEYAAILKEKDDSLVIEIKVINRPSMQELIHAYCRDMDGNYLDFRGVFSDPKEFFAPYGIGTRLFGMAETRQFLDISSFEDYLCNNLFKDGVSRYDEDTDSFYTVPFVF